MNPLDIFLPFQHGLRWLIVNLTDITKNYGLAIILFTLIIRGVLAPLYVIQIRSSKKMMMLAPQLKALQKQHGKDRVSLMKAQQDLYKEYGHNPALGCLLPLLQMPILFSLFYVLRDLSQHPPSHLYIAHFLWVDLGKPDPYHILPIVAGITQWIQQRMMLQPSNDAQQRQMNQILQFAPLMIVVFAWSYAAGLAVYWVTSNIIMMVMQYLISGVGQLFTDPFTIPYANGGVAAASTGASKPQGGLFGSLIAPRQQETPSERPPRAAENGAKGKTAQVQDEVLAPDREAMRAERESKMERYAAKHGRGPSRGRPSAKGAKK